MGFRLAPCLVLWDFKTDGWPPVPISNPSPQPRPPWIELRRALAWFRLAPCLVLWDFGWHLVWFYGISKLTDGPLSRSQTLPHSRNLLGLHCCCAFGWHLVWFYGISKLTDGPLSRSQRLPHSRDFLGVAAGLSAGPLSCFYGISKLTDGPLSRSQTAETSLD